MGEAPLLPTAPEPPPARVASHLPRTRGRSKSAVVRWGPTSEPVRGGGQGGVTPEIWERRAGLSAGVPPL
jgi:hypothetical protein